VRFLCVTLRGFAKLSGEYVIRIEGDGHAAIRQTFELRRRAANVGVVPGVTVLRSRRFSGIELDVYSCSGHAVENAEVSAPLSVSGNTVVDARPKQELVRHARAFIDFPKFFR
jgi:hypothetical protein